MAKEKYGVEIEHLKDLFRNLLLPKIFDGPTIPTQKVSECDASPTLIDKGDVVISIGELLARAINKKGNIKVILFGDPGNGKSTLLAKFMDLWANGKLPQFEMAFEINAKVLLSDKWMSGYSIDERDYPLACFIHYTVRSLIKDREVRKNFRLDKIISILEDSLLKGKILFVVDGIGSISHLWGKHGSMASEVMAELVKREHVVASSRPNILREWQVNNFPTKVEVGGFRADGMVRAVKGYYSNQAKHLLDLSAAYFNNAANIDNSGDDLIANVEASTEQISSEIRMQLMRVKEFISSAQLDKEGKPYSFNNKQEVYKAINAYYKQMESDLFELLKNPAIARMAESPMMLMIMLVLSEAKGEGKLDITSTPTEIFHKIVIFMAKIHISLKDDIDIREVSNERALESIEIEIFRQVAYASYSGNGQLSGEELDEIIRSVVPEGSSYGIKEFLEFGALRVINSQGDADANNLIHDYAIRYISFQAYLAAWELVNRLSDQDKETYTNAAHFVAHNRNDVQYLALFKFVAGILVNIPDEDQRAITIFYEALQCNLDEVFEVGDRRKAFLLASVLGQAVKDGEIDPRIPNLSAVEEFIDKVVMKNFYFLSNDINKSGYWSKAMDDYFWKIIERGIVQNDCSSSKESKDDHELQGPGTLKAVTQTPSFVRFSLSSDERQEKSMLEMAKTILPNIDNYRLIAVLLKNVDGTRGWEITEASMNVIIKIILDKKHVISIDEISYIIKQANEFINDEELKGCAVKVINVLVSVYSSDINLMKEILGGLLESFKEEKNNIELHELIKNIIVITGDNLVEMSLVAFIPVLKSFSTKAKTSLSSSANLLLSRSSSMDDSIDFFTIALNLVKSIIESGNSNMADRALDYLFILLRQEGDSNGNLSKVIGEILSVSSEETKKIVFERVMSNLEKDSMANIYQSKSGNTGVIAAINSVLNTEVELKTEYANKILFSLNYLLRVEKNKSSVIGAISKIASIATVIELELKQQLLQELGSLAEEYNSACMAIAKVAQNGEEIIIDQAIDIFFAIIDKKGVNYVIASLNDFTSGSIQVVSVQKMLSKLLPLMYEGEQELRVALANLLAKDFEEINDDRKDFIDHLIDMLHKSTDPGSHSKAAAAIYIICKDNPLLKSLIVNALIEVLKLIKTDQESNNQIKTNIVSLISKITDSIDNGKVKELFDLYRIMLESETCDGVVLKDAIGEVASLSPEIAYEMINSLMLLLDDPQQPYVATVIHSIGKIATKQNLDFEKTNLLLQKLVSYIDDEKLRLSIVYSINKILKNSDGWNPLVGIIKSLFPLLELGDPGGTYAIGVIVEILEKEQAEDKILVETLNKLKALLQFSSNPEEIIGVIQQVIGSMSLNNALLLLQDSVSDVREVAVEQVNQKLQSQDLRKEWADKISEMLTVMGGEQSSEAWTETINNIHTVIIGGSYGATNEDDRRAYLDSLEKLKTTVQMMGSNRLELNFLDGSFGKIDKNDALNLVRIIVTLFLNNENATYEDTSFAIEFSNAFTSLVNDINDSWCKNIENMLAIIGNDSAVGEENLEELYEFAVRRVKFLIEQMDNEEANLKYILVHFDRLVSVAGSVSSQMMEQVIHSLLADGIITINEREYIKKCIVEFNFTFEISSAEDEVHSPMKFVIAFGNKIYYLTGDENRENIDYFMNAVLEADDGILAKQYKDNKPVFINSGVGIPRAAVDVEYVQDLLFDNPLKPGEIKAFWIYETNDRKYYPEAALLLFTKEISGYFIGYKVIASSEGIRLITYKKHPDEIDSEFKQEIFGSMEHDDENLLKSRIYSYILEVGYEQGLDIIAAAKGMAVSPRETYASSSDSRVSVFRLNGMRPDIDMHLAYEKVRWDGDKVARKHNVKALYRFLEKFIPNIDDIVTSSWRKDSNTPNGVHGREIVGDIEHRDSIEIDLMKGVKDTRKQEELDTQINDIKLNPLQDGCFHELFTGLTSTYTEAQSARSGRIKFDDPSDTEKVGGVLIDGAMAVAGGIIPVVGGAAAGALGGFLKSILSGLNKKEQKTKIENILSFADPDQIIEIAKVISIYVSQNIDLIDVDKIEGIITGFLEKMQGIANGALGNVVRGDIKAAAQDVVEGGIDFVKENVVSHLEETAVDMLSSSGISETDATRGREEGKRRATLIAKLIIKKIADGEYKVNILNMRNYYNSAKYKAKLVMKTIKESYTLDLDPSEGLQLNSIGFEMSGAIDSPDTRGEQNHVPVVEPDEAGCTGWPSSGNKKNRDQDKKNSCTIMRAEVDPSSRSAFDLRSEAIASLELEDRRDAYKKFGNPENIESESKSLNTKSGMQLLYKVKALYGDAGYRRILNIYEDQKLSEIILSEAEDLNLNKMIEILMMGLDKVDPESENIFLQTVAGINLLNDAKAIYGQDAYDQLIALGMDDEITEVAEQILAEDNKEILEVFFGQSSEASIENFRMMVEGEESQADRVGFDQYINAAKYENNGFAKHAKNVIKNINHYYKILEEAYKEGVITNKVAIASSLLEFLLDYAASGQGKIVGGYRPPQGPGDDFGPGGGGAGQYFENNNGNQSDYSNGHNIFSAGVSLNITGENVTIFNDY